MSSDINTRRRARVLRLAAAAGCVAVGAWMATVPAPARAATVTWVNDADGSWTNAANWSGGLLPGVGDDVAISVAGDRLVTLSGASQSIRSLTLDERLTISNTTLTLATTAQLNNALTLSNSGVLKGGTVSGAGSVVAVAGTLDGVTMNA